MAGTNAVAVKQQLVAALAALPALYGVQILYSQAQQRTVEREVVSLGETTFTHAWSAASGASRKPRDEQLTIELLIQVRQLGIDPVDADIRAQELGAAVEEWLADNPSLPAVPKVTSARVVSGGLVHVQDDDGYWSQLTYQIAVHSAYIR